MHTIPTIEAFVPQVDLHGLGRTTRSCGGTWASCHIASDLSQDNVGISSCLGCCVLSFMRYLQCTLRTFCLGTLAKLRGTCDPFKGHSAPHCQSKKLKFHDVPVGKQCIPRKECCPLGQRPYGLESFGDSYLHSLLRQGEDVE